MNTPGLAGWMGQNENAMIHAKMQAPRRPGPEFFVSGDWNLTNDKQ
jgi:hypothetical protein